MITLGESSVFGDDLAKEVQFGWWQVPTRGSPSQFEEHGIFWVSDHKGSWIRMISKWFWVLSIILRMREFLRTFCEKILSLRTIISWDWHSHWNEAISTCSHGSQYTFWYATHDWINVSKMDNERSQLGDLLYNWSIWTNEGKVHPSWFQVLVGWFYR